MTPNRSWLAAVFVAAVAVAACNNDNNNPTSNYVAPNPPIDLVYQLNLGEQIGAGDSVIEPGVLLSWLPPSPDSSIEDFVVYGSDSTDSNGFVRRAVTTSVTWHDAGTPSSLQLQYYITSQDVNGVESSPSNVVRIDAGDTVQTPSGLVGTPLDSAAEFVWSTNSITGPNGSHFDFYRLYSQDANSGACDVNSTVLEGQTVSNAFVVTGLQNGVGRCYFVTAVTKTGHETNGSSEALVTPESTDPSFSVAKLPANAVIIQHHPIKLLHVKHPFTRNLVAK